MIKNDKKNMALAMQKAQQGIKVGQTPFGACIVKNNIIIACSHNKVWKTTDITAHAEIVAIRLACKKLKTIDLSGCTIYSTCEPCPMCFSACHWAKISKIVYGARISDAKEYGFNELSISNATMKTKSKSSMKIIKDFMREENIRVFEEFNKKKNKRLY
ncbi:MAG: nucleoside deaminase [Candidatus Omnitrophica bacterium]|nr:nucleoside deaminase [Candidatus Omnitrophota bacterium]